LGKHGEVQKYSFCICQEFIQLLKKLVDAGKWRRNLSKESLKAFVDALFDVDPEQCDLIQNIVNIIIPNILVGEFFNSIFKFSLFLVINFRFVLIGSD
jgi:hypothetical protein